MKNSRSILVLVAVTLSIALFGSVATTQTKSATATNVAVVQENGAGLHEHPDVTKALREVKFTRGLAKAGATFEATHPRFVRAIRRGKIPFQVFNAVWRGQDSDEIANLVALYEGAELTTRQLVEKLEAGDVRTMSSTCDIYANHFYNGCMQGGGDAFQCFLLTEQFLCWCCCGEFMICF